MHNEEDSILAAYRTCCDADDETTAVMLCMLDNTNPLNVCKLNMKQLGKEVGLSEACVRERVSRLKSRGILTSRRFAHNLMVTYANQSVASAHRQAKKK